VLRTASVEPGHLRVQAGLVDKHQPLAVPLGLRLTPQDSGGLDIRALLLGGVRRFFYSSNPAGRVGTTAP
jgi:hypothetical protein